MAPVDSTFDFNKSHSFMKGCKNNVLTGQNARDLITCYECKKPRCIYSKNVLTVRQKRTIKRMQEGMDYTCGAMIAEEDIFMFFKFLFLLLSTGFNMLSYWLCFLAIVKSAWGAFRKYVHLMGGGGWALAENKQLSFYVSYLLFKSEQGEGGGLKIPKFEWTYFLHEACFK